MDNLRKNVWDFLVIILTLIIQIKIERKIKLSYLAYDSAFFRSLCILYSFTRKAAVSKFEFWYKCWV